MLDDRKPPVDQFVVFDQFETQSQIGRGAAIGAANIGSSMPKPEQRPPGMLEESGDDPVADGDAGLRMAHYARALVEVDEHECVGQ